MFQNQNYVINLQQQTFRLCKLTGSIEVVFLYA